MSAAPKRPPRVASVSEVDVPPGPNAGRVWHDSRLVSRDAVTGLTVTQLTNYRGHSHHRIGPEACWLKDDRAIVLRSDREGCSNLFVFDFEAGALVQLTDLRGTEQPSAVRPCGPQQIAFRYGEHAFALELSTLRLRRSAAAPSSSRADAQAPVPFTVGELRLGDGRQALWLAVGKRAPLALAVLAGSRAPTERAALGVASEPCASPDGRRVAFAALLGGYTQVHVVDITSRNGLP